MDTDRALLATLKERIINWRAIGRAIWCFFRLRYIFPAQVQRTPASIAPLPESESDTQAELEVEAANITVDQASAVTPTEEE
ncbi:hypothetical protein EJG51_009185 [Undibacterium piscinae]|uniref:Uncharacterized protein n=1 Tax=Undibacterium piscinae TaxID=2495591 RepID=A0A6M4A4Y0_9BURK|nr:hypothetical protein EJG51_009185 [Undibacterium piscinae]